ncbi:transglycosylase domain-containing protein [Rhabdobacter roseus]|nr:transglycosylase domain-containing protein [Rhabdobacter roseus]
MKSYWKNKLDQIRNYLRRQRRPRGFKLVLLVLGGLAVLGLGLGLFFFFSVSMGVYGRSPSRSELKSKRNDTASEVYSADSVLLARYYLYDRTNVSYAAISPVTIQALIATEDVRFYKHHGIDSRSLARVLIKTLLMQKESSGGGSTLTQQLAKNLYPRRKYKYLEMPINKLQEMIIARRLESVYSKEAILELYLNTVSFGGTIYGIERASRHFFNVPAHAIKAEQAAVLVGMLKATTAYNPATHPERSKRRRNVVLSQMVKYGYLAPAAADSLKVLPIKLMKETRTQEVRLAPYFTEQLRVELATWCQEQKKRNGDPYNLYTDGLKIYTTIDSKMQREAELAIRTRMAALQKQFDAHWKGRTPWGTDKTVMDNALRVSARYKRLKAQGKSDEEIRELFRKPVPMALFSWNGVVKRTMSPMDSLAYYQRFLNTGLVSMEPATGYVRAWVGGINHGLFKYDHVLSRRQVGSTFKPIVYAAALQKGIDPCTYFDNKLTTYPEFEDWAPQNASNQYGGKYSMKGALAQSVNTVSAQIILKTGVDRTISLARELGIESDLPKVPSLALGVANLSLLEMVEAYTAFANQGRHTEPVYVTSIIDRNDRVLRQHKPHRDKQVLREDNAAIMLKLMQGVVEEGSGGRLRSQFGLKLDIAGKTGTTQHQSDGWFIGIVPGLVTGVWVGAESPLVRFRTLELGQGSNTALPIWGDYTARLQKSKVLKVQRFEPLPQHLQNRLDCSSYLPEVEPNFIDRVFEALSLPRTSKEERQERRRRKRERRNRGQ